MLCSLRGTAYTYKHPSYKQWATFTEDLEGKFSLFFRSLQFWEMNRTTEKHNNEMRLVNVTTN